MAETRPTLRAVGLLLIISGALAGCRKGAPSHEGASFGVSADGSAIAWTTGSGASNELWLKDATGSRKVASGRFFEAPAFTPDGKIVLGVGDGIRNRMIFMKVGDTGKLEPLLDLPEHSLYSPRFAPDGRMAFRGAAKPRSRAMGGLQWHAFDLYVLAPGETKPKKLTDDAYIRMSAPTWSPDGKRIAYSFLEDSGEGWLRVVDADSGKVLEESRMVNNESMPVYVGSRLALISDRANAGRYVLAYFNAKKGTTEPITRAESYLLEPQFAGGSIYALEDLSHKMRFRVSKIDPKTGRSEEVIAEAQFDVAPPKQ